MITLVFLICTNGDVCFQQAPTETLTSVEQCHGVAEQMIATNKALAEAGELPPHSAAYRCLDWGQPA